MITKLLSSLRSTAYPARFGFLFCVSLTFFNSCSSKTNVPFTTASNGITLSVSQLEKQDGDGDVTTYKARITLSKQLAENQEADSRKAMLYRMDSCFYFSSNGKKTYAALVQPVANGVKGTYEYLLEFEDDAKKMTDFTYQDRYLNKNLYSLKLNN